MIWIWDVKWLRFEPQQSRNTLTGIYIFKNLKFSILKKEIFVVSWLETKAIRITLLLTSKRKNYSDKKMFDLSIDLVYPFYKIKFCIWTKSV